MTTQSETRAGKLRDIAFAIMNTAESSDECADKVLVDRSLVGQLREALAASEPVEAVGACFKADDGVLRDPWIFSYGYPQPPIERNMVLLYTHPAPEQPGKGEADDESCESGAPECGPVEFHDSEGVPLCRVCWEGLLIDSANEEDQP